MPRGEVASSLLDLCLPPYGVYRPQPRVTSQSKKKSLSSLERQRSTSLLSAISQNINHATAIERTLETDTGAAPSAVENAVARS